MSGRKPRTKQKVPSKQDPRSSAKRSKSEEKLLSKSHKANAGRQKPIWPLAPDNCSPKLIKKFIKRTEGYNKQKFSDFLGYFDSGAFGMNIKRIDLFVQAVAKICFIKTEVETNDRKTTAETKIMIKRNVLRDLLTDPDFHSVVLPQQSLA